MTTTEAILSIRNSADKAKLDAKASAPAGMKNIDGNFAQRSTVAELAMAFIAAQLESGYVPVAVSTPKEAKTRPGSDPFAVKFEKVTVTLAELRAREEARKAKLKAGRDAQKVAADAKKVAAKVEAPATAPKVAPVVPMGLAGQLAAAMKAKKAA